MALGHLVYLARNAGLVLTRRQLLRNVWGEEFDDDTRTVDVHVQRLRQHLVSIPGAPHYLHTVRGVGYVLKPAR